MQYDKDLIASKFRHWETYLSDYHLPSWEEIPDFGLYMEQVVTILKQYLDYLPPELQEDQVVTAAAINNYVRKKIIPEPVKKKYFRYHLAYLIMICSLKQSLSIPTLQTLLPNNLTEAELKKTYESYANRHRIAVSYFMDQVKEAASVLLGHEAVSPLSVDSAEDLITSSAVISGFARLLSEKLLLLAGKTEEIPKDAEAENSKDKKKKKKAPPSQETSDTQNNEEA